MNLKAISIVILMFAQSSPIFCQHKYHVTIDPNWPPYVTEYYIQWEQWMNMSHTEFTDYINRMKKKEFWTIVQNLYHFLKYDQQYFNKTLHYLPNSSYAEGMIGKGRPVSYILETVGKKYYNGLRMIIQAPYIVTLKVDSSLTFHDSSGIGNHYLHKTKVYCKVTRSIKGQFKIGEDITFWYIEEWGDHDSKYSLGSFDKDNEYLIYLDYREERFIVSDTLFTSIALSPALCPDDGFEAFRINNEGIVNDYSGFWKYGESIPIENLVKNIKKDLSKLETK